MATERLDVRLAPPSSENESCKAEHTTALDQHRLCDNRGETNRQFSAKVRKSRMNLYCLNIFKFYYATINIDKDV